MYTLEYSCTTDSIFSVSSCNCIDMQFKVSTKGQIKVNYCYLPCVNSQLGVAGPLKDESIELSQRGGNYVISRYL